MQACKYLFSMSSISIILKYNAVNNSKIKPLGNSFKNKQPQIQTGLKVSNNSTNAIKLVQWLEF